MKQFWDERYSSPAYAYGTEPNTFFKQQLSMIPPGKLLLPAEGEGRNAVFAATQGWQVTAFDQSEAGKRKADQLASEKGVKLDYLVGTLDDLAFEVETFDAIGLVYAHFPAEWKEKYHRVFDTLLKPGGLVVFEAFSKGNLEYVRRNPGVGGPKDPGLLFSLEELRTYFPHYEYDLLAEEEVFLQEGLFHRGTGLVIRMVARKKA